MAVMHAFDTIEALIKSGELRVIRTRIGRADKILCTRSACDQLWNFKIMSQPIYGERNPLTQLYNLGEGKQALSDIVDRQDFEHVTGQRFIDFVNRMQEVPLNSIGEQVFSRRANQR